MIYAVYRVLYGEDFIQQSIRSILPHVDKVFVFWDDRPWGSATQVRYRDQTVTFPRMPRKFDAVLDKVLELQGESGKIELIYDHVFAPQNQFTHLVNDLILPNHPRPDTIMFIEPDHVFRSDQIKLALRGVQTIRENPKGAVVSGTAQVELWRTTAYCIPPRPHRHSVMFWDMIRLGDASVPPTGTHANPTSPITRLPAYVHNLGFCVNPSVMLWKHLTALAFSREIKDSLPNEDWYESKWLRWDFEDNNQDLEISLGYEHTIPSAMVYKGELPETLR